MWTLKETDRKIIEVRVQTNPKSVIGGTQIKSLCPTRTRNQKVSTKPNQSRDHNSATLAK